MCIRDRVTDELKEAIKTAQANISKFHEAQLQEEAVIETSPGVRCWRKIVPINRVGLYIPGGTAPLFSTVLMLAVPARIAGCPEIILCTPPDKRGNINPLILYAALVSGVTRIFRAGGAQAVSYTHLEEITKLKEDLKAVLRYRLRKLFACIYERCILDAKQRLLWEIQDLEAKLNTVTRFSVYAMDEDGKEIPLSKTEYRDYICLLYTSRCV